MFVYIFVCIYVCVYVYICTCICAYVYICAYISAHRYVYTCECSFPVGKKSEKHTDSKTAPTKNREDIFVFSVSADNGFCIQGTDTGPKGKHLLSDEEESYLSNGLTVSLTVSFKAVS